MRVLKYILVAVFVLLAMSPNTLFAQRNLNMAEALLRDTTTQQGPVDSLGGKKKDRPRKPLNSYLFADSLRKENIYMWNIRLLDASVELQPMDTLLNDFQKNYPFMKKNDVGAAYIGPLGAAETPLNYASRSDNYRNSFLNPYTDYIFTPESVDFYNGKTPFSQFEYFTAGQRQYSMEHIMVNHAQNISPSSSFDFKYQNNKKRGHYENQQGKNKNLSLNFAHTGPRYTLFMGYINNIVTIDENGGVQNVEDVVDTVMNLLSAVPVNLEGQNNIRGNQVYMTHSYAIPLKGNKIDSTTKLALVPHLAIGMSADYSAYRRVYIDRISGTVDGYYDNWFFTPTETRDSLHERTADFTAFAKYQPFTQYSPVASITGGVGYTNEQYYQFKPADYFAPEGADKKNSTYLYGSIDGRYYQYLTWQGRAKYFFGGYRSQDISFGGDINLMLGKLSNPIDLKFTADISNTTPNYWSEHFSSNHYIWDNDFKKQFKVAANFSFMMRKYHLELGLTQTIESDKIYYNQEAIPVQATDGVSVTSIFVKKNFVWKGLNLNHKVDLQFSSNQSVAPVPLMALNLTYFYDIPVVRGVLNVQLGVDGYYNTKYYGYGYNPAIGQFYAQRDYLTGAYPLIDAFAVGKWKRLRFILKMQNLTYGWGDKKNSIMVYPYPLDSALFTFGFSWSFYN